MLLVLWKKFSPNGKACSTPFLCMGFVFQPFSQASYSPTKPKCLHTLCQTSGPILYRVADTYNWSCNSKQLFKGAKGRLEDLKREQYYPLRLKVHLWLYQHHGFKGVYFKQNFELFKLTVTLFFSSCSITQGGNVIFPIIFTEAKF